MVLRQSIDFGPGENHIALRFPNKCYYVPELFHLSPFYNTRIPLLMSDINSSPTLKSIYGIYGGEYSNVLMINNYPVRYFEILGKVVGEVFKEGKSEGDSLKGKCVYVSIDDSSGSSNSVLVIEVPEAVYLTSGLSLNESFGKIVKAHLVVCEYKSTRNFFCDFLNVEGDYDDLSVEIEYWSKTLQFRVDNLVTPWVFQPSTSTKPQLVSNQLHARGLFSSNTDLNAPVAKTSNSNLLEDSIFVAHNRLADKPSSNSKNTSSSLQITKENDFDFDQNIEIVEVNEYPVSVVTESQLYLAFIRWILKNQFKVFRLADIYKDLGINSLLDNFANVQKITREVNNDNFCHEDLKKELFHSIRHTLQIDYKLISVNKSQTVKSNNLQYIYNHLKRCLLLMKRERIENGAIKILNLERYLKTLRVDRLVGTSISYKLINVIIDFIITSDFDDSNSWRYDSKSVQWVFIGSTDPGV